MKNFENDIRELASNAYGARDKVDLNTASLWANHLRSLNIEVSTPNNILFIESGCTGLKEDFFRLANIHGRFESTPLFNSIHTLALTYSCYKSQMNEGSVISPFIKREISFLLNSSVVVFLTDISVSGNSVAGELTLIKKLVESLDLKIEFHVLGLNATDSAFKLLSMETNSAFFTNIIPTTYSFLLSEGDRFFSIDKERVEKICDKFYESFHHIQSPLRSMSNRFGGKSTFKYGFGEEGWLITSPTNTPNNSLPFLWSSFEGYDSPFKRTSSYLYKNRCWEHWNSFFATTLC